MRICLALLLLLGVAMGCDGPATPVSAPTAPASATPAPTATTAPTPRATTTPPAPAGPARDRLRTLTTDPALRTEAVRGRTPRECADAFEYALTVDALAVTYVDCPPADTEQPVTLAIIDLLVAATPL